ncbi:MAG: hypothetical protein HUU20_13145 [Pirellulales bacterium]|nr:hypothetical protein [Pirellulales bacterium]
MGLLRLGAAGVVLGLASMPTFGQRASAVQLPTYSYFTVGTSVSVPDRGGAWLDGVDRAGSGVQSFGSARLLGGTRAFGTGRSAAGVGITATIHDFEALEAGLVDRRVRSTNAAPAGNDAWTARLDEARVSRAGRGVPSVAAINAELGLAEQAADQEAAGWLQRGRQAEEAGKPNVAKIYYGMAARRATGSQRREILARIAGLQPSPEAGQDAKTSETRR